MSFDSLQSITIDTVATDLNRVQPGQTSSLYSSDDGTLQLKLSHQESKGRIRHLARLDKTVIATDPLTAENASQRAGCYTVFDEPAFGFTNDDMVDLWDGYVNWLVTAKLHALLSNRH